MKGHLFFPLRKLWSLARCTTGVWGLQVVPSSSPECKWWHGFVVPCQNRVVWYPLGVVYGLCYSLNALTWTERGLIGQKPPGSKFAVKTVNKPMPKPVPKPVPWSFLTCPCILRQESQALSLEHLSRTRQDQVICDLEWRGHTITVCWLKRAVPPPTEFFPSGNSVFCIFSAELLCIFMPLHHGMCCHGAPRNLPQDRQLEGAMQSNVLFLYDGHPLNMWQMLARYALHLRGTQDEKIKRISCHLVWLVPSSRCGERILHERRT